MTDRIRWVDGDYCNLVGYVGGLDSFVFQIWKPGRDGDEWVLTSALPGQGAGAAVSYATEHEPLKAEAERLLEQFATLLGASFPDHQPEPEETTR
jgi:hypothetical protein